MTLTEPQWKGRGQFQHHFRVSRQLESWKPIEWRTTYRAWCEACVRGRGRNADHKRTTAEQDHVVDTVSIDNAPFGECDQTAKLVLMLREHKCRCVEACPVQNKVGQDVSVVKSVADMFPRTGLQRSKLQVGSRAIGSGLEEQGSCSTGWVA